MEKPEPLSSVLTKDQAYEIALTFGTPTYVYSQRIQEEQADKALAFPNAYGLTVRCAMKANPNVNLLRIHYNKGILIDSSSGEEALRAISGGIKPEEILLTSQKIPKNLQQLVQDGIEYNACSLHQLDTYGKLFPHTDVSIRLNPGRGSGGTKMTNTGGPAASFGIWHADLHRALAIAKEYGLNIKRVHTHIGSGSDPDVWQKVSKLSLDIVEEVLHAGHAVQILNLGGGYKMGRMSYEKSTDLQDCGEPVARAFERFAKKTGVLLKLEIEPGTFLFANAGAILATVEDIKQTPKYTFVILDAGMTENVRPLLYAAQHPVTVVPVSHGKRKLVKQVFSGPCCESGDIQTPAQGDPEVIGPRLTTEAKIGDLVVIGGTGAYCAGMSIKNYNSYPEAAEVLIDTKGTLHLLRKRQTLDQIVQNEIRVL
ncbi:MAG: diaminopimelate decarboxylase [Candidatus Aenigmarchaeota archaeon]|nr:diaminopimelate decarboxylase [Candidatus Aenigmarchaeota archaeon]